MFNRPPMYTSPPPTYTEVMAEAPPSYYYTFNPIPDFPTSNTQIHRFQDIVQPTRIDLPPRYLLPDGTEDTLLWSTRFRDQPDITGMGANLRSQAEAFNGGPFNPITQAWTPMSQHYYLYTPANNTSTATRQDPNVGVAIQACPVLRYGSFCLDPYYSQAVQLKARNQQTWPSHGKRTKRRFQFWKDEQVVGLPRKRTVVSVYEERIPKAWRPCYEMHRSQRILARDPFLSIIENFVLRMAMSNLTYMYNTAEVPRSFQVLGIPYRHSLTMLDSVSGTYV